MVLFSTCGIHNDFFCPFTMPPKLIATTRKDQIRTSLAANYEQWGSRTLSLEQYLQRDILLRTTPFAKNLTNWILIDDENSCDILSACETYERPCMASNGEQVINGSCFAIASVYTPPQHRKKGYAGMMLDMLLSEIKSRPNAIASTLYSDIGPTFYSKKGWKVYPSISLNCELDTMIPLNVPFDVTLVTLSQARPLLEIESIKIQHDFNTMSKQNQFMILPTFEAQEWHHKRSVFYTRALAVDQKVKYTGATYNGTSDFITWSHDIEDSNLYITHVKASSRSSFQSLLRAAVAEAQKWKFKVFELWDPSEEQQKWAREVSPCFTVVQRTKNLSSLAFWGLETKEPLEWKYNEQHCWV